MAINDYLSGIQRATTGEKADVGTATTDLANMQTGAGSLPAKLKEALNTKLNNNKDIINQQADTMQNYFNSGAQAREKYQDVWNPFEKAKLVQQERSMALRPYDVLSGVLENRMGDVNDIVQSGIQGWQGLTNAAATKLETAKSMLTNALQSYLQATNMQQNADQMSLDAAKAAESSRQFEKSYGLDVSKFEENKRQFDKQFALEKLKLSGGGSSGKSAENTLAAWNNAVASATNDAGYVNEQGVWNYINQNQTMLARAGVNVQDLWDAHKRLVGNRTPVVSTPNPGFLNTPTTIPNPINFFGEGLGKPITVTPGKTADELYAEQHSSYRGK